MILYFNIHSKGNLCTTQLADRFGRKTFLITSLLGVSLGLVSLSSFLYLNKNGYDLSDYAFVPVICLAFVVFIASAGSKWMKTSFSQWIILVVIFSFFSWSLVIPLSHVCRIENLPSKVRPFHFCPLLW